MTATTAARSFSELLNRVAAGEEIEIARNGVTVAVIGPPRKHRFVPPARFREIMAAAPPVDEGFMPDLDEIRSSSGTTPGDPQVPVTSIGVGEDSAIAARDAEAWLEGEEDGR